MKSLQSIFPRASKSFLEANPALSSAQPIKTRLGLSPDSGKGHCEILMSSAWGNMNKTEAEFARLLEIMKRHSTILRYEYEGITLRWQSGVDPKTGKPIFIKYTPDFVVFGRQDLKFIEVKGPFIKGNRERAIERFRHARTYWSEFSFEMHQKTKEGWKQIL